MERQQIIEAFVKDPEFKAICKQIAGSYADDLYQELALIVLELPEDKLQRLNETCIKCFFYRIAQKQFCSRNSAFYRKYLKDTVVIREHGTDILKAAEPSELDGEFVGKVNKALDAIYWYDAGILALYAEKGTLQEVSNATGIPLKSVHDTVTGAKKLIRKKITRYE